MIENRQLVEIQLDDIFPSRFQPRIEFEDKHLISLADSIRKYGVLQPIIVRKMNNKYEIIAGERRCKASRLASKKTIPAIVIDLPDNVIKEVALLENVQRQQLSPIEEAVSYKKILDSGSLSLEELSKQMGKPQKYVISKIELLKLDDEVQEAIIQNQISEGHARSLLKIKNTEKQRKFLNKIIEGRMTVKRLDEEIEAESTKKEENIKFKDNYFKEEEIETLMDENEEKRGINMDIDKILNEARDINLDTKTSGSNVVMNNNLNNEEVQNSENKFLNVSNQEEPKEEKENIDYSNVFQSEPTDKNELPAEDLNNNILTENIQQPEMQANPYMEQPGMQQNPYMEQPKMQLNPYMEQPEMQANPYMEQPEMQPNPYMEQPKMQSNPYMEQPEMQQNPYMEQPEMQQNPYMEQPKMQQNPYMEQSGMQQNPYIEQSGMNQNPYTQPGMQQNPYMEQPGIQANPYMQQVKKESGITVPSIDQSNNLYHEIPNVSIENDEIEIPYNKDQYSEVINMVNNCCEQIRLMGYLVNINQINNGNGLSVTLDINKN